MTKSKLEKFFRDGADMFTTKQLEKLGHFWSKQRANPAQWWEENDMRDAAYLIEAELELRASCESSDS